MTGMYISLTVWLAVIITVVILMKRHERKQIRILQELDAQHRESMRKLMELEMNVINERKKLIGGDENETL